MKFKLGVLALALVAFLILRYSPQFKPRHVGPGESRWLGLTWVGPQERKAVYKAYSPERDVIEGPQDHVLGMGPRYSPVHYDATWMVELEGYGLVPVSKTCFDKIKIGDVWSRTWNDECK